MCVGLKTIHFPGYAVQHYLNSFLCDQAMTQALETYEQPLVESGRVQKMFGSIAHRYDLVNTVLSGGTHYLWRNALLRLVPDDSDASALDVCTGTGDLLPLLDEKFGFVAGVDFCYPMLSCGMQKKAVKPFPLLQGDALSLPFVDDAFDVITIAFGIRNLENLSAGLLELKRVLRPKGALLILEFG
ncbi:MAG: class I SAM-dependent methyltransferase, partial [Bdellovibrionales bacterium]|nr:class I SAM-dependent methyltransferase [Bdellovibrionales bacterium]